MCRGNHSEMQVNTCYMYRHIAHLLVQQLWPEKLFRPKNLLHSGRRWESQALWGGQEMLRDTFVFNPNSIKYFRFGIFFFKIKQWGVVVREYGVNQ